MVQHATPSRHDGLDTSASASLIGIGAATHLQIVPRSKESPVSTPSGVGERGRPAGFLSFSLTFRAGSGA
jgi:hypothetical protein